MILIARLTTLWLLLTLTSTALAQDEPRPSPEPSTPTKEQSDELPSEEDAKEAETEEDETAVVTESSITLGDETIQYRATAGMQPLLTETGETRANIFHVAYERLDENGEPLSASPENRPITFCFNGGPGSSSVWLHLGAWGPVRVDMGDAGKLKPAPWTLVPNDGSLLDVSDLVFIDPVTTGFSRSTEDQSHQDFHGLEADADAVAEFIRLYLTRNERWLSPKYIAGESYGTTRAAVLAERLQRRHGVFLNGVILVSAILDFQTTDFAPGNDVANPLYLPTFAATAWYHGKLPDDISLQQAIERAEAYASNQYLVALYQGSSLPEPQRQAIARSLATLTGLPAEYIVRSNLRLYPSRFRKELLRDQRRTVGRLDSRFTGVDADAASDRPEYDPSYAVIQGPYTAAMNHYVRVDLGFESDVPYEILTGRVHPWDMNARNRYLDVSTRLTNAMLFNPELHVFLAEGLYDLATPFAAAEYTLRHMELEPEFLKHVTIKQYESGHMMYLHDPSRAAMRQDLLEFYGTSRSNVAE
ncbi:MAG: peptidase S10 [Planctomycetota bacterium]|nr:peptidase S10 [Planctomycetota bacterium]